MMPIRHGRIASEARVLARVAGVVFSVRDGQDLICDQPMIGLIASLVYETGARTRTGGSPIELLAGDRMPWDEDELAVLSDHLQSQGAEALGYPVGELLALWNAQTSCTRCHGTQRSPAELELSEYGERLASRKIVMDAEACDMVASELLAILRSHGHDARLRVEPDYLDRTVVVLPSAVGHIDWSCPYCDGTGLACGQRVIEILDGGP